MYILQRLQIKLFSSQDFHFKNLILTSTNDSKLVVFVLHFKNEIKIYLRKRLCTDSDKEFEYFWNEDSLNCSIFLSSADLQHSGECIFSLTYLDLEISDLLKRI